MELRVRVHQPGSPVLTIAPTKIGQTFEFGIEASHIHARSDELIAF